MNFYASQGFLDAAAAVWFKGRDTAIENVRIGGDVLRLLVVDGRHIVTRLQFLDVHQPLAPAEVQGPVRQGRYARNVVRGVIGQAEWKPGAFCAFDPAPFVDWSGFSCFDAFKTLLLARHKGLLRDRERRWRNLAATRGELCFTMNDPGADVLPAARQWKRRQLRATGIADWFARRETMEFLETLRERGLLVSSTLRAGGRLVSAWIGFVHEGCWSGWVFGYDPDFAKFSPGHKLIWSMLEESFRLGHREFYFSEGGEDYKLLYATHCRLLGEIGRPPLARRVTLLAKRALGERNPGLLRAVQDIKREAAAALVRRFASLPAPRAGS
ncbi:MAG TPA: GNAT family N-acetyltransferase [Rhizomicrobium sp.]|nr:GNAT family N-acetyltransferase [Rhizomicrobium sp.]